MGTTITWRGSPLTSALHAAEAIDRGQKLVDPQLAGRVELPSQLLANEIRAANLPSGRFWGHLLGLSAAASGRRLMVEAAVMKTAGRVARFEEIVTRISACVSGVEAALVEALPNLADELTLRMRPLREQWEARGDGMLAFVGRNTDESLVVADCDVIAVYPATGGRGGAHLAYNSARVEAVLANPMAELPEVCRLAWLIAQLNSDLPKYSDAIHADRLGPIAAFAMLPAVLAAAEEVELVRHSPTLMATAIEAWHLQTPEGVDCASLIAEWWHTYLETRPPWRVALTALDRLFG